MALLGPLAVAGHQAASRFAVRHVGLAAPTAARGLLVRPAARPRDEFAAAILRWTVVMLPVNWLCGTTPFWCYGAALLLLFRARAFSLLEALFLWLIVALSVSVAVGVARGAPLDRAFAAVYNLTILVVMIGFLNGGQRLGSRQADRWRAAIYHGAFIVFALNVVLIASVFVLTKATGTFDIAVRTFLLGLAGPLPGVFNDYAQVVLAITDWTVAGPQMRVIGFGIYATEGALLFLLLGLLGGVSAFAAGRFWRLAAIEGAIVVGLIIMASRTTLGAYALSFLLLGAMQRGRLAKLAIIAAPLLIVGGLGVAFFGGDAISQWIVARNQERLGSSDTRFLSYATGAAMVMAQNPLTGLGIKPVDLSLMEIPIGSHSTLSSMFTKGGFIGLGVVLTIFVTLLVGVVRSQVAVWGAAARRLDPVRQFELIQLSRCVVVILLWWTTEDLDAPAHEAAFAGLCFGLFWSVLQRASKQKY